MDLPHARFALIAAWPLAALVALTSIGGLASAAYAQETPAWMAQAVGQDWFDLVVLVPGLAICGLAARRRSYRSRILLAGAYAYTAYELVIYAFAIHFNTLFLLYCATLGVAGYALVAIAIDLARDPELVDPAGGRSVDRRGARLGGVFLLAIAGVFALLWLAEDVPALLHHAPSHALAEAGLFTNPVHVLDYAFVLPAHVLAGSWLLRRTRTGALFAAVVLAFGVLMAASIGGMMLAMQLAGAPATPVVMLAMFVIAAAAAAVLARLLRRPRDRRRGAGAHPAWRPLALLS